jgi:hypothetical protein
MNVREALRGACLVCVASLCWSPAASADSPASPPIAANAQALAKVQNTVTLTWVGQHNWQLYVENTNRSKFINVFDWDPPIGLTIKSITSSEGGTCKVAGGRIHCSGNIAPLPCNTCAGGGMTIDFVGLGFDSKWVQTDYGGYWIAYGWQAGNLSVTAVSSFSDLPACAHGQVSTKAKPCAKA